MHSINETRLPSHRHTGVVADLEAEDVAVSTIPSFLFTARQESVFRQSRDVRSSLVVPSRQESSLLCGRRGEFYRPYKHCPTVTSSDALIGSSRAKRLRRSMPMLRLEVRLTSASCQEQTAHTNDVSTRPRAHCSIMYRLRYSSEPVGGWGTEPLAMATVKMGLAPNMW